MKKHRIKGRVKSMLNCRKPALWIILVLLLACLVVLACLLTMLKKKSFDPIGTWELSAIIQNDEELSTGYLVDSGVCFETFTLHADGTGSWTSEYINPGKSVCTIAFTYTLSGNALTFINSDHSSTVEVVYDPQKDALRNKASYTTYIYHRVNHEAAVSYPTIDQLSGVWKSDGTSFGEDQILFGSLVIDENGSAEFDLSTGGGSMLQKEYAFVLDGNYICLSTDEGSVYGLYDPKIDAIFLPFKHSRSLLFTRTNDPIYEVSTSPASAAQTLPGIWELAWMESTRADEYWEEKQAEDSSSREPYIASFPEEYELFNSGKKRYTMILYEKGFGQLLIQIGGSTTYATFGFDENEQVISQSTLGLKLHFHFDGAQLILEGDGFRVGFKRFDFISPSQ